MQQLYTGWRGGQSPSRSPCSDSDAKRHFICIEPPLNQDRKYTLGTEPNMKQSTAVDIRSALIEISAVTVSAAKPMRSRNSLRNSAPPLFAPIWKFPSKPAKTMQPISRLG